MFVSLPPQYWVQRENQGTLAILREYLEPLQALGYSIEQDGERVTSSLQGRGNLQEFHLPGRVLVIRRFLRGGLARHFSRDRFLDPDRPFEEIRLGEALRAAGIATPRAVAARCQRLGILGFRLELVTERVEGARSVGAVMRQGMADGPAHDWPALVRAAACFIRRMHDAGLLHSDLQPENLLWVPVQGQGPDESQFSILDLDRSRFTPNQALAPEDQAQNLWRLWRYVLKRESPGREALFGPRTYLRFLRAYELDRGRRRALNLRLQDLRRSRSRWHSKTPRNPAGSAR
ncbi:MAG: lipopolysaccharide kinase InaA family protein [Planctomycetota bacterium]